jgi:8-oxo-dGTP pyrophosphatase MutT (NUDIX family)
MTQKTKKAQVVIAAVNHEQNSFSILLLQTNEKRGQFWQNVTGKIEENETYEEGGLREAIEETNLKVDDIVEMLDLELSYEFVDARKRDVREKSFLLVLDKMWNVVIDPKEHQDFKWVGINDVYEESVKHKSNLETIRKSQKLLKHWGM